MSFDQKILIIRFSSIGDIVLTTSPLKTIRNRFPNAQISYVTLEEFAPLLEFHPDIDRLIPLSKNMTVNLIAAILATNIIFAHTKLLEGFSDIYLFPRK